MFRRSVVALMVVVLAGVATACPAPPPEGWVAPVVTATVSPSPVVAGEPFEVEVVATDRTAVVSLEIALRPWNRHNPGAAALFPGTTCTATEIDPGPTVTRLFSCTLPPTAPNGAWRLEAFAHNTGSDMYRGAADVTFEVTGGSDDQSPPVLVSYQPSANPVVIGETFAITVRVADDSHLSPTRTSWSSTIVIPAPPGGPVNWRCDATIPERIDETTMEWRFTGCLIPEGSAPGTYAGGFNLADALGNSAMISSSFQAVAR